ncbi:hypothetical protein DYU11_19900 [Fibrisoma montanum]|uniref:Uncharacterized protein n=1 Tax=Fibrisoma montanum TaxID=2305895 RepID=A0A418M3A7_9BACT|nr:hypothetical protein [Fibrisoma montanum]RIV20317.1 hypothetical protein DYU11_19900 [Fibrisoma montanum]
MNDKLPDIKQVFEERYFKPARKEIHKASYEDAFIVGQERFQQEHGFRLPFGLRQFKRHLSSRTGC